MALTDMAVRNAKPQDKAYKLTDSNGLFLFISPAGSKMMQWWADYLDANREGYVTPYEFAHPEKQ